MEYEQLGNPTAPALVCVPGLLGGPEDFRGILDSLQKHFCILILDPNSERRKLGLANLTEEVMREISFNATAQEIELVLQQTKHAAAYLLGVSLGGKIVYDFASKYPKQFLGGVITDVGLGPFEDSELYQFVDKIVQETDLNLPWAELKNDLQQRIHDRSMRSLIQTQIFYPDLKPPAVWKTAMQNFRKMLHRQAIDDQFSALQGVDQELYAQQRFIHVLKSAKYSGISAASLPVMASMRSLKISEVPDSSHFIHVTHKELIQGKVLEMGRVLRD